MLVGDGRRSRILTAIVAAISVAGCRGSHSGASVAASPQMAATAAIESFHRELDAGDYDSIWSQADEGFRRTVPRDQYLAYMTRLHRALGEVVRSDTEHAGSVAHAATSTVLIAQNTRFVRASGLETFTFQITPRGAVLLGYNVQSSVLDQ